MADEEALDWPTYYEIDHCGWCSRSGILNIGKTMPKQAVVYVCQKCGREIASDGPPGDKDD